MSHPDAQVLWIDRHPGYNGPAIEMLMAHGISVVSVDSAASGLAVAAQRPFGLILVDAELPDMHCLDAISALVRSAPAAAVVLTALPEQLRIAVHATRLGASDVLSKPLVVDEIIETATRALEHRATGAPSASQPLYEDLCALLAMLPRITLGEAAGRLRVDRHVIERTVRLEAGVSFREWRKRRAMHRSAHLIAQSSLSIKEVAYDLGYQAPRSFIRAFKAVIGMAPAQFRARVRGRVGGAEWSGRSLDAAQAPSNG